MTVEVVVVSGAGSIGRAIARRVGSGRTVLFADHSDRAAAEAAEQLRGEGYEVATRVTDVSDPAAVEARADAAAELGAVTQVVHTAGVSPTQASVERIMHVDLLGTALILDAFARVVAPGGAGLVVDGMAGHRESPYAPRSSTHWRPARPRSCSRCRSFRPTGSAPPSTPTRCPSGPTRCGCRPPPRAWGKHGARVNAVSPGVIVTPLAQDELSGPRREWFEHVRQVSATGRFGTPDEVAEVAAFLLGRQAGFITGADLLWTAA